MNQYIIFSIGFLAQICFSARLLVQWIRSEKAGRVLSPVLFWQLSILASFLMMIYGILRQDLSIIIGQTMTYGIYIRNLYYKGFWDKIPRLARILAIVFPILAISILFSGNTYNFNKIIGNQSIPLYLLFWGITGQFVFTFRFVYQWYYTEKQKQSVLPIGFWVISISGSLMVLSYAVIRRDPVLFVGQIFGTVVYSRNILIWLRQRRTHHIHIKRP
jgi:lipid-A-disaccharide synthase-like uncharacterized protein